VLGADLAEQREHVTITARAGRIVLACLAVVATGIAAYAEMYSQFQYYDDEGDIMTSVKSILDGRPLYDETYAHYGPFYYLLARFAYTLTGVPVSHDVTRLATIALWLATAAVAAVLIYKLTASFAWALAAYLQTIVHCRSVCNEPGHPQAILILLSMSVPMIAALLGPTGRGAAVLGVAAACMLLTKINVGVYAIGALLIAFLGLTGSGTLVQSSLLAASTVAAALPFVLMRGADWALNYARIAAMAAAACCLTMARADVRNRLNASPLRIFIVSVTVTAVVVLSLVLLSGTSVEGLVASVIVRPIRFPTVFSVPWRLPEYGVLMGEVSVGAAVIAAVLGPAQRAWLGVVLKIAFAMLMAGLMITRGPTGMVAAAPLLWVTLLPPRRDLWRADDLFPRAVLCLSATAQLLIGYPVAGSQQYWATLLLIPAAIINLADASTILTSRLRLPVRRVAEAVALALIVWFYYPRFGMAQLDASLRKYHALTPLGLPGATRLRLEEPHVRVYRDIADTIERNCDTFISMPGFNSLYFWTRQDPPTGLNTGPWMTLFDGRLQQQVIDRLAGHKSACVIYNRLVSEEWVQGRDIEGGPLVQYIRTSFRTVRTIGDFEFMIRTQRQWPDPP